MQGKDEPLWDYTKMFNKGVVQVWGADEKMNKYLIEKGFRPGTNIKKIVQIDEPQSLNEFMKVAKTYIKNEEKLYLNNLNKARKNGPHAKSSKKSF